MDASPSTKVPSSTDSAASSSEDGNKSPFFLVENEDVVVEPNQQGAATTTNLDKREEASAPIFDPLTLAPAGKDAEAESKGSASETTSLPSSAKTESAETAETTEPESKGSLPAEAPAKPEQPEQPADLLYWKKPIKSAGVLATATFLYWLFWKEYSLITTVSMLLLGNMMLNGVWMLLCKTPIPTALGLLKHGEDPRAKMLLLPEMAKALVRSRHADVVSAHVKAAATECDRRLRAALSCPDWKTVVQVGVTLYALSRVGNWFSPITLAFVAFVAVMSVPVVYRKNQTVINAKYVQVRDIVVTHTTTAADAAVKKFPQLQKVRDYITSPPASASSSSSDKTDTKKNA